MAFSRAGLLCISAPAECVGECTCFIWVYLLNTVPPESPWQCAEPWGLLLFPSVRGDEGHGDPARGDPAPHQGGDQRAEPHDPEADGRGGERQVPGKAQCVPGQSDGPTPVSHRTPALGESIVLSDQFAGLESQFLITQGPGWWVSLAKWGSLDSCRT